MKDTRMVHGVLVLVFSTMMLAQSNPVPFLNQPLLPTSAGPGMGDLTLTVNGTGFASGSLVNWNSSALSTNFVSGSQLNATVPAANLATASTATVTVVSPVPGGGVSTPIFFPITAPTLSVALDRFVYPTGADPIWVESADLNADGNLDLISADGLGKDASVYLGNGNSTFQPKVEYPIGGYATQVVARDFNGDNNLDLAVVSEVGGLVSILIGKGDGTFQPHQDHAVGPLPHSFVSGDFNGDGRLDLAFALQDGQAIILLGNGDGTFQNAIAYSAGPAGEGIIAGDFNGDDKLDLVIAVASSNVVSLLLGNGDGTFQPAIGSTTASSPHLMIAADLNGDGKLDLAMTAGAGTSPDVVCVLLGNGDGTFQAHVDYLTRGLSWSINAADLNGDGHLDVAVTNLEKSEVLIFLANGDGTLREPIFFPTGSPAYGLAEGDFNGDGRLDLAVANANDDTVSVLPQVAVILSRSVVVFGKIKVGTKSHTVSVIFSNTGEQPVTISGIALTGSDASQFTERNNCGSALPAESNCLIQVLFEPSSQGKFSANVTIANSGIQQPQTILLQGIGRSGP